MAFRDIRHNVREDAERGNGMGNGGQPSRRGFLAGAGGFLTSGLWLSAAEADTSALPDDPLFQKYRNEELLRDLLPVMDNLERAIAASDAKSAGSLLDGVKMTANMFKDVLSRFGVKPIESVGGPFNPEFQEAIATLNDPGRDTNSVIEELEKGYMYQDRLLRPAKVVVSTK